MSGFILKMFFPQVTNKRMLEKAEEKISRFERTVNVQLPHEYRDFLLGLETYIEQMRIASSTDNEFILEEHIDDLFCDHYFVLPGIQGEFNIIDLANSDLGYALLEEMQLGNSYRDHLLIGNVWHSANCNYFLSLSMKRDNYGAVYLLADTSTNNELDLSKNTSGNFIFVSKSFKEFLEKL